MAFAALIYLIPFLPNILAVLVVDFLIE